jgi:hypothetical protein
MTGTPATGRRSSRGVGRRCSRLSPTRSSGRSGAPPATRPSSSPTRRTAMSGTPNGTCLTRSSRSICSSAGVAAIPCWSSTACSCGEPTAPPARWARSAGAGAATGSRGCSPPTCRRSCGPVSATPRLSYEDRRRYVRFTAPAIAFRWCADSAGLHGPGWPRRVDSDRESGSTGCRRPASRTHRGPAFRFPRGW